MPDSIEAFVVPLEAAQVEVEHADVVGLHLGVVVVRRRDGKQARGPARAPRRCPRSPSGSRARAARVTGRDDELPGRIVLAHRRSFRVGRGAGREAPAVAGASVSLTPHEAAARRRRRRFRPFCRASPAESSAGSGAAQRARPGARARAGRPAPRPPGELARNDTTEALDDDRGGRAAQAGGVVEIAPAPGRHGAPRARPAWRRPRRARSGPAPRGSARAARRGGRRVAPRPPAPPAPAPPVRA